MQRLHQSIRRRVAWYDRYHRWPYAVPMHWALLVLYGVGVLTGFALNTTDYWRRIALADTTPTTVELTSDADWNNGTLSNITVASGTMSLAASTWQYRDSFVVTNNDDAALAEYQVMVTVNTSSLVSGGKLQADCDDLRFYQVNDDLTETALDYYIDYATCNTSTTTIWVQVADIDASDTRTVRMYYGNAGASAASDETDTFSYTANQTVAYAVGSQTVAGSISIVSLIDGNTIGVNGVDDFSIDEQETGTLGLVEGDSVQANGLIYGQAFENGSPPLVPASFAGTSFLQYCDRFVGDEACYVGILSPWGTANVDVFFGASQVYDSTVGASGVSLNVGSTASTVIRVVSDIPVLVAKWEDGAEITEANAAYPATSTSLYGVPSRRYFVVAGAAGASFTPQFSDSAAGTAVSLGANAAVEVATPGLSINNNHGLAPAGYFPAATATSVFQNQDSDGRQITQFLPKIEAGTVFGSVHAMQYVAIADPYTATSCTLYDANGGQIESESSSGSNANVRKIHLGDTSDTVADYAGQAWKVVCDKPVIAYYEKTQGVLDNTEDETNLFSYKQMRQYVYPEPSVGSLAGEQDVDVLSPGTFVSAADDEVVDLQWNGGWGDGTPGSTAFAADVTVPSNSSVVFDLMTADDPNDFAGTFYTMGTATSTGTFTVAASAMPALAGENRYVQIRASLVSTDTIANPSVAAARLTYLADDDPPTNPTATGQASGSDTTPLASGNWYNYSTPKFTLAGASDEDAGIAGYYVYFGTDSTAIPSTAGAFQVPATYTASLSAGQSGSTFYLRVQAYDNAQNLYTNVDTTVYTLFTYLYDVTLPTNPSSISVAPAGFTGTNSFTFTWPAGSDAMSGIAGYYYVTGEAGASETLTTGTSASDIEAYQDGTNQFKVQAVDVAGNRAASYVTVSYFYTVNPPSAPQNVAVTPDSSTTNSFTFSWDEPFSFVSPIAAYHYSINVLPTANNTTSTNDQSVGPIPAATQQGTNTFYVVAEDEANNIDYDSFGFVNFEAATTAPGIPVDLTLVDSSDRDAGRYSNTIAWSAPDDVGSGIDHYVVARATSDADDTLDDDDLTLTEVASSSTTAYIDTGLDPDQRYYYQVYAEDDAAARSAGSTIVNGVPEGRFTTPPAITEAPAVTAYPYTATFTWETERGASSLVEFGLTEDLGDEQGTAVLVADHSVTVEGLTEQTRYFFRVKSVDRDGNIARSAISTFSTTAAPFVFDVTVNEIRLTSAILQWSTNQPTTTQVNFGPTAALGQTVEDTGGSLTISHTLPLRNLNDSTTYQFRLGGRDTAGNNVRSDLYEFTTLSRPRISSVTFANVAEGQTEVRWQTNVPANSLVAYTDPGGAERTQGNEALVTDHSILLFDLANATAYSAVIRSADVFGNEAQSDAQRFTTLSDTTPPILSNIKTESFVSGFGDASRVRIIVGWRTNEPTTGQVEFGSGSVTGDYPDQTDRHDELILDHVMVLSDLESARTYNVRIQAVDAAGNASQSDNISVLTSVGRRSFLQLVVQNLEQTFAWIPAVFGRFVGP